MIEDNEKDVTLVKNAISEGRLNISLRRIRHWRDAIAMLRAEDPASGEEYPHIILMSINKDQPDWETGLRTIKKDPGLRRIPIIITSSEYRSNDVLHSYESHANCYVLRPHTVEEAIPFLEELVHFWVDTVKLSSRLKA